MAARWESEELRIIFMLRLIQPPSTRYVEGLFRVRFLENPRLDSKIQKRILRSLRSKETQHPSSFSILDSNLGFS